MIGLAADIRPFFARVNPNAAEFTPHSNKIRDWDSGLFCLHQYLSLLATAMKRGSPVLRLAIRSDIGRTGRVGRPANASAGVRHAARPIPFSHDTSLPERAIDTTGL